jgi:hypothetical protein
VVDLSTGDDVSSAINSWNSFRDETERLAGAIGGELRDVVDHETWKDLDIEAKCDALEAARRLIHDRHELVRDTWLEWDDDDDPGLMYDETSGAVHFPRHHLDTASAEQAVGGLAEEMRHAWQFDVVDGRLEHPLGEVGRQRLGDAHRVYDPTNLVKYTGSELEMDAQDFAADVIAGYRGER